MFSYNYLRWKKIVVYKERRRSILEAFTGIKKFPRPYIDFLDPL